MAKFCGKCGTKLDKATGLCPNCDTTKIGDCPVQENTIEILKLRQEVLRLPEESLTQQGEEKKRKADMKTAKRTKKKEKQTKLTTGQKVPRFFLKLFLRLILLVVIAGGIIGGLSYMGILDIPLLSDFNKNNILETLNESTVIIEETGIVMETENKGTATIIVQIPDYEFLFKEAYASKNPELYLVKALAFQNYKIQKYEEIVTLTVEKGKTIIHSDEVVYRLLEEALVNAINALSEVK